MDRSFSGQKLVIHRTTALSPAQRLSGSLEDSETSQPILFGFGLMFWLPLLVLGTTVWMITHEFNYARLGGQEFSTAVTGSTPSRQASFLAFGATGALLLLLPSQSNHKAPFWALLLPCFLLAGYVMLSISWSDNGATTFKRGIVQMCIVAAGFGFGKHWSYRHFCWAIIGISTFLLGIGVLAEIYYGTFLRFGSGYRFSGVMHPAKEAFNCAMLALACLSLYFTEKRFFLLPLAVIAIGAIVLTQARTGFAASLVSIAVLSSFYVSWRHILLAGVAASGLLVIVIGVMGVKGSEADLLQAAKMGRVEENADPTKLTGRLPIWKETLSQFSERPALGFGYGAFWTPKRLEDFFRKNDWALTHAHNAYIELLVNVGLIGFSLCLTILAVALTRAIRLSVAAKNVSPIGPLALSLLVFACLASLTEIAFVGDGFEIMAMAICIGLLSFEYSRTPDQHRKRVSRGAQLTGANS